VIRDVSEDLCQVPPSIHAISRNSQASYKVVPCDSPVGFRRLTSSSSSIAEQQQQQQQHHHQHYKRHVRPGLLSRLFNYSLGSTTAEALLQVPPTPPTLTRLSAASAQAASAQDATVQAAAASPADITAAAQYYNEAAAAAAAVAKHVIYPAKSAAESGNSNSPDAVCGPLTVERIAAAAVNYTVMLMVTDASTAHDLLHHWLGNVRAAGISYYLIAAADDATSRLLVERGLQER
jgi:hypothetical protein